MARQTIESGHRGTRRLPGRVRSRVAGLYRPLLYSGTRLECPCCTGRFRDFVAHRGRRSVRCPGCGSMERHRILWLWLAAQPWLTQAGLRILHIAPEPSLQPALQALPDARYLSADLASPLADEHFDVADIPHPDEAFDLILCNHVLEHVADDRAVLRELRRVLAPGGRAVLMSPIALGRTRTEEDPAVVSPQERLARYGQEDHVRLYGAADYERRIADAGFVLERHEPLEDLTVEAIERHRLRQAHPIFEDDVVHVGHKPA